MKTLLSKMYAVFIAPRSSDDEGRRREFILNVILAGSLGLAIVAFLAVSINSVASGYGGESPMLALITVALFSGLFIISRTGHHMLSSYALVLLFLLLSFYTLLTWGIVLGQGLLTLALVIVMASVLLGTRFGAIITIVSSLVLITVGSLQSNHLIVFDSSWRTKPGDITDAIGFSLTLAVITIVSWLSNREIERSLDRARNSEGQLKKERDGLEIKVVERTKELEQTQREKIMELSRFAEFGRLTAGIVHELVTPITTVALNLEQMHDEVHSERLRRAVEGTKRLERYIEAARKQLQHQSEEMDFNLSSEIETAIEFLSPQAETAGVQVSLIKLDGPKLYGNPIKFHQMVTNLIANAISSYEGGRRPDKRRVAVELWRVDDTAQMTVRDWGSGIPEKYIDKIFDPFFTLKKSDQGTGIGLSLSKGIIENELGGTIGVVSDEKNGTTFTVQIPLNQDRKRDKPSG